jgi:hypothetical protein
LKNLCSTSHTSHNGSPLAHVRVSVRSSVDDCGSLEIVRRHRMTVPIDWQVPSSKIKQRRLSERPLPISSLTTTNCCAAARLPSHSAAASLRNPPCLALTLCLAEPCLRLAPPFPILYYPTSTPTPLTTHPSCSRFGPPSSVTSFATNPNLR